MNDFAKILVPVDYSEHSDAALRLAANLARTFNGRLLVLHCIPIETYALADPIIVDPEPRVGEESARLTAHVRKVLGESAPPFEVEATWGFPHVEITHYAIEQRADLIVVGTHGRTGIKHLLLGSVAERTVRLAPCPVLTVRGDAALAQLPETGRAPHLRPASAAPIRAMMAPSPVTVSSTDSLQQAHARMIEAGVRHLPVVDGGRLVGMLSDRDLGPYVGHFAHTRVNAAMTPDPMTANAATTVDDAARLMLTHEVRALPVVEGGRLVGMISSTDILEDYIRVARA